MSTQFSNLGLSSSICEALEKKGYTKPTPIQEKAIPLILKDKDVMASAQTGTGKTAGFTLPIIQKLLTQPKAHANTTKVLVLTPTRELAAQIQEQVELYGANTYIRSTVVFGGVSINPQMMKLRKGVEILIATPGRLLDLYNQKAIRFTDLTTLVLDEADRMADMGFMEPVCKILDQCKKDRQTILFSATLDDEVADLVRDYQTNPVTIEVGPKEVTMESMTHYFCLMPNSKKSSISS